MALMRQHLQFTINRLLTGWVLWETQQLALGRILIMRWIGMTLKIYLATSLSFSKDQIYKGKAFRWIILNFAYRTDTDRSTEWHKILLAKLKEEEREKKRARREYKESNVYHFLKTCNLTFGTLLYSLANYAFLYWFEIRRYHALTSTNPQHDLNWVFMYGQVLTTIIVPLIFLIIWKLKQCSKPLCIQLATSLIPLLVVLSLVLTSGRLSYDTNYISTYLLEVWAGLVYTIALVVIKYKQKSLLNTFQTLIYSEMLMALVFYTLKYFDLFVWVYADDVLYKGTLWYAPLYNLWIIIPGVAYLFSMYLMSLMMFQSLKSKSGKRWSRSKIRVTTLLCLKAFECEILTFISLFISIEYLDVIDVFGMLIFIIAILIMSCDDTSAVFIQTVCMKRHDTFDVDISEESFTDRHKSLLDRLYEFYVVETDESILVKHRECPSSHYKEASIERFNLKFYGIKLPNVVVNHSDEKEIIRRGLTDYTEDT